MGAGVLDAGIAIGWIRGGHRSAARIDALLRDARTGRRVLYISAVNLAEVLLHTGEWSRLTGGDAVALLRSWGVRIHTPDEAVARRVARLDTSLPDGFAAATAQELGARLHTTDGELARRLRGRTPPVTLY